jgi:hypothetical protein
MRKIVSDCPERFPRKHLALPPDAARPRNIGRPFPGGIRRRKDLLLARLTICPRQWVVLPGQEWTFMRGYKQIELIAETLLSAKTRRSSRFQ